jgi:hypothetical protein
LDANFIKLAIYNFEIQIINLDFSYNKHYPSSLFAFGAYPNPFAYFSLCFKSQMLRNWDLFALRQSIGA